jgi:DNA-binding CsgD family transcriptional regulator
MTTHDRAREASEERTLREQADRHAVTLEAILAALRSGRLDDRAARRAAIDIATDAIVDLRARSHDHLSVLLEPVTGAFERLRRDLAPLLRYGDLDVQFVAPPANGRALPGEVAHAARAIVRNAVLAFVDTGDARRVRIEWGCDGLHLLIGIRDGRGDIDAHDDSLRPIVEHVSHLGGTMRVASTPGWGTELSIQIPLDPPEPTSALNHELTPREREILVRVAGGARNVEIARDLSISEHTVKFHVSKLLRRAGARNRAELAAAFV